MTHQEPRVSAPPSGWQDRDHTPGLKTAEASFFEGKLLVAPWHKHGDARLCSVWLHSYVVLLALTVWVLVFSGGLVTSKGVGLSVPDWPTTYGYNMFAFPLSRWVGGIFYEHSHRLLASGVGFMTIILAVWMWIGQDRKWLRWLGIAALCAVVLQGVLGGLRVVWLKDQIGIFHACLAQAFLALVSFMAFATSRWWSVLGKSGLSPSQRQSVRKIAWLVLGITVLIYTQLALGAAMRHAHADLSIRDFPRAYGHWWPPTDSASITEINQQRLAGGLPATNARLILLQMFHRLGAFAVAVGVVFLTATVIRSNVLFEKRLRQMTLSGGVIISLQIVLGVYTIWTNKAADVATTHVAVGAASLVWSVLIFSGLLRWSHPMSSPNESIPVAPQSIAEGTAA